MSVRKLGAATFEYWETCSAQLLWLRLPVSLASTAVNVLSRQCAKRTSEAPAPLPQFWQPEAQKGLLTTSSAFPLPDPKFCNNLHDAETGGLEADFEIGTILVRAFVQSSSSLFPIAGRIGIQSPIL
eukprot:3510758-Rhodomonas_salina.1